MKKIGWNRPDAPKRIYRVRVESWAENHDLCADSEISCLDAYLKALCYSELHDLGGTSSEDGPEDNDDLNFRQVPQDFPYYPSTFSEMHPKLTAEIASQWWRDALTANRVQARKEDAQHSAPQAAQGMTSQDDKEHGRENASIPSVDPVGRSDRTTNKYQNTDKQPAHFNDKPPSKSPSTASPKTPQTSNGNADMNKAAEVTPPTPTATNNNTKAKPSLKPSSYGQAPKPNPSQPTTKAQELLDLLNSTADDGLEYNVDGETVFANLILQPKEGVHPWLLTSEGLQEALEVARSIDTNFAFISISDSMAERFPPLTDPNMTNFPATPITLGPYVTAAPNQMILVRPGATYADGTPKKQPTIYATVRFISTFSIRCIMQWLGPELDMRGMGFNSKAFQVPASQTRLYLMGTRHEFCPAGLKHDLVRALKMEVKADAIAGKLNRADAEALDMQSIHIKKQGLKESRLTDPINARNLGMSRYSQTVKATMGIELANKHYPFFHHYLKRADTSGTLRLCCGENTRLIHAPINPGQSEEKSASWMSKMRANASYLHKSKQDTLRGIVDPDKQVRSQWIEGERETSPWQKKTVTVRKLLEDIADEVGNKVFHAINRVMLGPEAGSLRVATYRTAGIQRMVQKVKTSPTAWIYHYGIHHCKLTVKCMDKVVSGCDFDEVLLIESTTWDQETMTVTTPFLDNEDAFVREMEEKGFELDITALAEQPPEQAPRITSNTQPNNAPNIEPATQSPLDPNASTIPAQEQEWAHRLNISGNNSFTTKASDAVSRADDATNTTDGAESFNADQTIAKRNYRESILEQARLKAMNAVKAANKVSSPDNDEDSLSINSNESSTSFSQGKPASNGSAASIPKTTAKMQRVSKDGGAKA